MNAHETLESVVADQLKPAESFPEFSVGDTLNVHTRIIEGDKERIQVYQGVLIAEHGRGILLARQNVERIAYNEAGNIEEIVRRLPRMGPRDELIFVEGGSGDDIIFGDNGRVEYVNEDGKIVTLLGLARKLLGPPQIALLEGNLRLLLQFPPFLLARDRHSARNEQKHRRRGTNHVTSDR